MPQVSSSPAAPLALRSGTGGNVSFGVASIDGRSVVHVEVGGEKLGALLPIDGENLAEAARMARRQSLPLVCHLSSSGADVAHGVAGIH
ncbi:MAG: hypothetical protein OSA06_05805, partial [Acidimicrobiales bacterium]|nr:hypothetical protein [Acidimicrobiales bacterium]